MLFEEGFKLIRVRQEPLKKIYDTDVISKQPYNGKQVTNDILSMILSIFELETKLVPKIKAYQSKDVLQIEKGLEKYIDKILTEKAEKMELKLTDEMIISIKNDVIPRLKFMYNISTKEQLNEKIDEIDIDWVDVFQVMEGYWDISFGLKEEDFDDNYDYSNAVDEKWEEEFEIDQEQMMLNLGQDWLEENEW